MNLGAYRFLKGGPIIFYLETFLCAWQGVLETTYPELQMIKIAFPYIEISRVVGASPNRAWDLLTDTFAWEKWGPSIIAVRSSERYIGKGSHGRVKTALRFWEPLWSPSSTLVSIGPGAFLMSVPRVIASSNWTQANVA